jgi:hypothetical protein
MDNPLEEERNLDQTVQIICINLFWQVNMFSVVLVGVHGCQEI